MQISLNEQAHLALHERTLNQSQKQAEGRGRHEQYLEQRGIASERIAVWDDRDGTNTGWRRGGEISIDSTVLRQSERVARAIGPESFRKRRKKCRQSHGYFNEFGKLVHL
jgi:hypothetical protein